MQNMYQPFSKFGQIYLPKLKVDNRKGVHLTYPIRTNVIERIDVQFMFTTNYNPITKVQSLIVDAHGLNFDILLDGSKIQFGVESEFILASEKADSCDSPRVLLRPTKYYRDKYALPPYFYSYNGGRTMETNLYMVKDVTDTSPERILLRMTLMYIENETYMAFDVGSDVNIVFNTHISNRITAYHLNTAFETVITTLRP